jgi:hypothetical protein
MPMDLNRNDWIAFARVWMAGMTFLGAGLLLAPAFLPPESAWISKGTGTALLLVAASILFVVVFEALGKAGMGMTGPVASVFDRGLWVRWNHKGTGERKSLVAGFHPSLRILYRLDRSSVRLDSLATPVNLQQTPIIRAKAKQC